MIKKIETTRATFTLEQLKKRIIKIAQKNPQRIYAKPCDDSVSCSYVRSKDDDNNGCLIGCAILSLQPNLREFLTIRDNTAISTLLDELGFLGDLSWFNRVQVYQDSGIPWIECVCKHE